MEEEVNAKKIFSNIEDILEFTSKFSEDLNQLIVIDENGKKSIIEVFFFQIRNTLKMLKLTMFALV